MGVLDKLKHEQPGASDPILTRLVAEDRVPWYRKPNLRNLYLLLFPACMGIELTSGFDSQMINALQIVPSWKEYFDNPQGSLKGIIAAVYSLGAILSLPLVPWVNDRFGRRWSIFIGSCIMCIGAIIQGLSVHVGMYILARAILGFGIPTCIVSGAALIGELGHPKERPMLTTLFNISYSAGMIIAAGICFRTNTITNDWAWRIPSLLQVCPSLFQMSFIFLIPESPRWLISKDRSEQAFDILAKYHAEGDRESEFVKAEMAQINATIKIECEASQQSWLQLLKDRGMRRRAIVTAFLGLFTQWSGNTLIAYYLGDLLEVVGVTDSHTKQQINLGSAGWSLVSGLLVAMLVVVFRRRVMYMTCTISLLVVYICWTVTMSQARMALDAGGENRAASIATIAFIFLYGPCYSIGFTALTYTYLVEIWPFTYRSRGIAFFQLFGRCAGFFTTFVNPIGLQNASWKYLISYCCWIAFEIVFVFFMFPETAGRTLEELAFMFENSALAERAVTAVKKAVDVNEDGAFASKQEPSEVRLVEDAKIEVDGKVAKMA